MPDKPTIPQFCCATCCRWTSSEEGLLGEGICTIRYVTPMDMEGGLNVGGDAAMRRRTLDLAVCSKWEKADHAEDVMYGKRA